MEDILGREINIDDLVLTKASGRHSSGMKIGIWNGTSITYEYNSSICNQVYLIENPSEKDLEIKNKILKIQQGREEKAKKLRDKKMSKKKIPQKDLIIGKTYLDDEDYKWIYLGKGTVFKYIKYRGEYNYSLESEQTGLIYIKVYSKDENNYNTFNNYKIVKTPKRLVEKIEDVFEFNLDELVYEEDFNYHYNPCKKKLEFKLDKQEE
ncbi:hypothetical protein [Clostridium botulinum]|uniref:hypothetical protein n=1 Tax=Clostridium botulinum TaxID=1491 RepID=UPI001C9B1C3B|nr:hypothetical protein [Clostridium botulinum]MBY6838692.1 hypothetical protein [Clostridium botulinum]